MHLQKETAKEKIWITNAPETDEAKKSILEIAAKLGINPIIATLLYNRGYKDYESARSFIRMENEMLRNPFDMIDMMKGGTRAAPPLKSRFTKGPVPHRRFRDRARP